MSIIRVTKRFTERSTQSTDRGIVRVSNPIPDLDIRCEKHPSIPRALCACKTHQKTVYKRSMPVRLEPDAKAAAINRASFTAPDNRLVTICIDCCGLVTDHTSQQVREYTKRFNLTIFTQKCKHCGESLSQRGYCDTLSQALGRPADHERMIIRRSKLVACCVGCSVTPPIETRDSEDYDTREALHVSVWREELKERTLDDLAWCESDE